MYQIGQYFSPGSQRGHRFDDPAFGMEWPLAVSGHPRAGNVIGGTTGPAAGWCPT
jgi:hypothetical protein